jgi:hypothetical protein
MSVRLGPPAALANGLDRFLSSFATLRIHKKSAKPTSRKNVTTLATSRQGDGSAPETRRVAGPGSAMCTFARFLRVRPVIHCRLHCLAIFGSTVLACQDRQASGFRDLPRGNFVSRGISNPNTEPSRLSLAAIRLRVTPTPPPVRLLLRPSLQRAPRDPPAVHQAPRSDRRPHRQLPGAWVLDRARGGHLTKGRVRTS